MRDRHQKDWKRCRLGDLLRIKHGFAFKGEFFAKEGDLVVLTPGNFREEGGLKLEGEQKYYQGEFPEEFLLKRGELLVVMTDLTQNAPILGSPAFIPENERFLHNQRLGKIVDVKEDEIDRHFLFYVLNTREVRGQIKGSASGATVRHTSPDRMYEVSVCLPPGPVQRRIAAILSAYDELIENNQRRIRILEEIARSIYREWFVEFQAPAVKLRKATPPEKKATGKDVFPIGWELRCATDVMIVNPPLKVAKDVEQPFVPMSALKNDSMLIGSIEYRRGAGGSKFQNLDTLFARITPCLENGKTAFVQLLPTDQAIASGSTEFIVLRSKTVCPEFVYLLARSDGFRNNAIKSMSGATGRQRVQEECFKKFPVAHPGEGVLASFHDMVGPMFSAIQVLANRNDNLRRTRDFLLPRLMSGEVDVRNLESATADDPVRGSADVSK